MGKLCLKDHLDRDVIFRSFLPQKTEKKKCLIAIPGLGADGDMCFRDIYLDFVRKNAIPMIVPIFPFEEEEWYNGTSYHFANDWACEVFEEALSHILGREYKDTAYLFFGFSAGGQFALNYAFNTPLQINAVAAHAFGGFNPVHKHIDSTFLLTVGKDDHPDRLEHLRNIEKHMEDNNIEFTSKIISGPDHSITDEQIRMSFEFFEQSI